jgi:hypothetical protein
MKKNLIRAFNRAKVIVFNDWKYNIVYLYLGIKYYINKKLDKPVHYFCDFCSCAACKYGWKDCKMSHAPTVDGKWICNVCYSYDLCTSGPNRNYNGPCEDKTCQHRPKLSGPFI